MLQAQCHCGEVRLELHRRPRVLTRCTCSVCHRYGAWWAYYTRKSVRVIAAANALSGYRWGDATIVFQHCRRCGCLTHYESVRAGPDGRLAVNARMLPPAELVGVRLRTFDGAASWSYLEGEETL